MPRQQLLWVLLLVALCTTTAYAEPGPQPPIPVELLAQASAPKGVRVLVQLDQPAMLAGEVATDAEREAAVGTAQDALLRRLSGGQLTVNRRYRFLPGLALRVDAATLKQLWADPAVARVTAEGWSEPALASSTQAIGAPEAWSAGYTASGWAVAVLDTGFETSHPLLRDKTLSEACFSTNDPAAWSHSTCPNGQETQVGAGSVAPVRTMGQADHGTSVAGVAVGNGGGLSGVARDADLIAIQVFSRIAPPDCCNRVWDSDLLAGLEHVYALRTTYQIAAVNLSLGSGRYLTTCDSAFPLVAAAVAQLRATGIATIIGSGNNGYASSTTYPGCLSGAITVGATHNDGTLASFSNAAPFLDLLAPGVKIRSAVLGGGFRAVTGTSLATPHVAGAWAVLKAAKPNASVDEILDTLQASGTPVWDSRNNLTRPFIRLDSALNRLLGKPALRLDVRASTRLPLDQQQPLTYTLVLQNVGVEPIAGAEVRATFAPGLTLASPATLQGGSGAPATGTGELPTLIRDFALAPGQTATLSFTVGVRAAPADGQANALLITSTPPGAVVRAQAAHTLTIHPGRQSQEGSLQSATASDKGFASALALDGDRLAIGAPSGQSGAVLLYERAGGEWQLVKRIAPGALASDSFGGALALSGDTLVVGAPGRTNQRGAVYIYGRNQGGPGAWGLVKLLTRPFDNAGLYENFGRAVSLHEQTLAVGTSPVNSAGSVYLFGRDQGGANSWGLTKTLTPVDGAPQDRFGADVVLDGGTLAVGAPRHADRGAVYVFERDRGGAGQWGQAAKLMPGDGQAGDWLGSLALRGETLAIAAPDAAGKGKVRIFQHVEQGPQPWVQKAVLDVPGVHYGDWFGEALQLTEAGLLVGAPGHAVERGAILLFQPTTPSLTAWRLAATYIAGDGQSADYLGAPIATDGEQLLVGAPGSSGGTGKLYRYYLSTPPLQRVFLPMTLRS